MLTIWKSLVQSKLDYTNSGHLVIRLPSAVWKVLPEISLARFKTWKTLITGKDSSHSISTPKRGGGSGTASSSCGRLPRAWWRGTRQPSPPFPGGAGTWRSALWIMQPQPLWKRQGNLPWRWRGLNSSTSSPGHWGIYLLRALSSLKCSLMGGLALYQISLQFLVGLELPKQTHCFTSLDLILDYLYKWFYHTTTICDTMCCQQRWKAHQ